MTSEPDNSEYFKPSTFFDKGNELIVSHDRLFATLYSALIGAIFIVLIREQLGQWPTTWLAISLAFLCYGLAYTLLHIKFHCSMLLMLGMMVDGMNSTPNLLGDEPTLDAYQRYRLRAQLAFENELIFMLLGVSSAGLGLLGHLWTAIGALTLVPGIAIGWLVIAGLYMKATQRRAISTAGPMGNRAEQATAEPADDE